jgi:hypothetical protein
MYCNQIQLNSVYKVLSYQHFPSNYITISQVTSFLGVGGLIFCTNFLLPHEILIQRPFNSA